MDNIYYLNRIASLYRDKPKFIAWLTALLNKGHGITTILEHMDVAFDLDNAVGVQLDTLGEILGQGRTVNFQPTDGSSPVLDDSTYRVLLKAKVVKNLWKGQIDELQPIWQNLFPDGNIVVRDNQDMTMDVAVLGEIPLILRDLITYGYIVPKPQSVGIKYYFFGETPIFGYDISNDLISGYDQGYWAIQDNMTLFGYDQDNLSVSGYDKGVW